MRCSLTRVTAKLRLLCFAMRTADSVSRMLLSVAMTTLFCGRHVYRITAGGTAKPKKTVILGHSVKTSCLFYLRVDGSNREDICLVPVITVFLVLSGGLACPSVCL